MAPLTDQFAAIAPRFSGFTSAIASSCIIYLIARSKVKLSSIYHRIMFGMSIADVIGSVAMGLTTLPMPKDWYRNEIHNTAGARLGNKQTCQAQGFFFVAGVTVMYGYNFSLCIYYACAIALRLKEIFIAKYLEPFYHLIPLAVGSTAAIIPLVADMYHPTGWEAWCTVQSTVTANDDTQHTIAIIIATLILFLLGMVIIAFIMIIWRVMATEILLKSPIYKLVRRGHLRFNEVQKSHDNTKVILFQALAYIFVFIFTLTPAILRCVCGNSKRVARLQVVLMPLQGFFNLLIFVSHKIYNYRRVHQDVSRCEVLWLLFRGSPTEPVILSRISIVQWHKREEVEYVDIEVDDDEHNVAQLSLALNVNENDNNEENDICLGNEGVEVTADQINQTIENLFSSSFLDRVKIADGAHNSSTHSDIISISSSSGGLSGLLSKLSGLISDGDDTNHEGESRTKKEVTSYDNDSSCLSYQSSGRLNVSMEGVSVYSASTQELTLTPDRSMSSNYKKSSVIVDDIEKEIYATPDSNYNLSIRNK